MQVRVLLFGQLKESAGFAERAVELADGASVRVLLDAVSEGVSAAVLGVCAVAVNQRYAQVSHVLMDGDEVAILPPVSGGQA